MVRVQRASEGFKHGNGKTHDSAVENVKVFFEKHRKQKIWHPIKELLFDFNTKWIKKDSNGKLSTYRHSYDLGIVDKTTDELKPVVLIEVDGEKHSKSRQKTNDQRAERYANEFLKVEVIRIKKLECNGLPEDREKVFREALRNYIK